MTVTYSVNREYYSQFTKSEVYVAAHSNCVCCVHTTTSQVKRHLCDTNHYSHVYANLMLCIRQLITQQYHAPAHAASAQVTTLQVAPALS